MSEQLDLFSDPRTRARTTDPDTSHDAARSLTHVRESQEAVLRLFRRCGPMTDTALVSRYETVGERPVQSPSGLRTRRSELTAAGLVIDTGRRVRLPSGRRGIVWKADDP